MLLLIASTVPLAVGGGGEGVAGAAVRGPEESAAFKPDPAVHIFFYAWFGNPSHPWGLAEHNRGNWREWNQEVQAHWDVKEAAKYTSGKLMNPPEDAATAFFPERGLYSSIDPNVAAAQMQEIAGAGAGVVVFSWWRDRSVEPYASDGRGNGPSGPIGTDRAALIALDAAAAAGVRVCFHLEPYDGRDHAAFQEDVAYLLDTYGTHEAFYRDASGRPLWYVYDSYRQPAQFWATLLTAGGARTLRGTRLDGVFIGLYLSRGHERYAEVGGFDGLYTYFAATAFSDGTRTSEWPRLATWAQQRGKLFVPCVGPGYDDSRLRPWNSVSWRYRAMGRYYQDMWADAIASDAPVIAVTSFNEWGEGTQIEPAASARSSAASGFKYQAYGPDPQLYLRLTATAVADWAAARLSRGAHARSVPALPLPTRPAAPTRHAQSVPCPAAQRLSGGSARRAQVVAAVLERRTGGAEGGGLDASASTGAQGRGRGEDAEACRVCYSPEAVDDWERSEACRRCSPHDLADEAPLPLPESIPRAHRLASGDAGAQDDRGGVDASGEARCSGAGGAAQVEELREEVRRLRAQLAAAVGTEGSFSEGATDGGRWATVGEGGGAPREGRQRERGRRRDESASREVAELRAEVRRIEEAQQRAERAVGKELAALQAEVRSLREGERQREAAAERLGRQVQDLRGRLAERAGRAEGVAKALRALGELLE
jgi:glycoprotein endo-alpha-1,2-mannosidase